jgi:Xaa-Pro aminopeptidase
LESNFYRGNRETLYETLADGTLLVLFSGRELRKTADEYYLFYANRNFVYMTGIDRKECVLVAEKRDGKVHEMIFVLEPDMLAERWTGTRLKDHEVRQISGVEDVRYTRQFEPYLTALMKQGWYSTVALDLYKHDPTDPDTEAFNFAARLRQNYPHLAIANCLPQIRKQRTIKQPCEIEAMREAVKITRAGIEAMMKTSRPGMYEYEYRAEFLYALAQRGVMEPAFPPIISAGSNNFCIHYFDYHGMAKDGDMILNDVGARYDFVMNDVSRAFPCNGKFSEQQRLLYTCAYNTSEYMFGIIKPGMPMADVDRIIREYNFRQLQAIGLCDRIEDVGKYMWHGGAHHIGFDTHDVVDLTMAIEPGMVFCVDVGIYHEEWGIGFRLEDNCLVTTDGCENLTASIPRTIAEIESIMNR